MSVRTALYRYLDRAGALLYVGVADRLGRRLNEHEDCDQWSSEAEGLTVTWYPNRVAALNAERDAIRDEKPRHNRDPGHLSDDGKRTPIRSVRISDVDWADLLTATVAMRSDRGTVIRQMLRWYLRRPGAKLPERPPAG